MYCLIFSQVAIKTLIITHGALREVDQSFHEELTEYSGCRGHMLNLSHFKDDSSPSGNLYSLIYSNQKSVPWRTDHLGFPVVKHGSILLGYVHMLYISRNVWNVSAY